MTDKPINISAENDPVVLILRQALDYKASEIEHRINHIEQKIVDNLLAQSLPNYASFPVPTMAMLQLKKRDDRKTDKDPVINTQGASFTQKTDIREYHFLPLIDANIIHGHVADIRKGLLENTWVIELEAYEWVDSLSGLAFYIKKDDISVEQIEIYSGDKPLPLSMMADYNHLPFNELLPRYMQYSENEELYKLLMHWHDILCSKAFSYCVVRTYDKEEIPLQKDGDRIRLNLKIKSCKKIDHLEKGDILLNCIPIINAEEDCKLISEIQSLDLEEGKYLIADDVAENPFLKKRKYGTTHKGTGTNKEVYIALHPMEDNKKYQFIHYLASEGVVPVMNGDELKSDTAEFTSATVIDTFLSKEPQQETEHLNGIYHLQTHDRIVTPTDILSFCKTKLVTLFNYQESEITSMDWKREDCKVVIQIEGSKEREDTEIMVHETALKAMIFKRSASLAPINIDIIYHCKQ